MSTEVSGNLVCRKCGANTAVLGNDGDCMDCHDIVELLAARQVAYAAWQQAMTPDTERALGKADDALRWAQRAQNRRMGLTGADRREAGFKDVENEDS